ncbi:hypothetical protein SODALDRAFT_23873 [Sodiomyces alkalinus F11]|uniref:RRM domain-containing protein n=1 Tax=Sodiomyces alkalinus (strain CBS 110278 / VKM F-3762 / F11) TaxID=1314773 RepID=A0A3N2Q7Q3_SODAK|nr:hypothetical protein SODALDRAFT_23873 [Sodiomyces alkalinus F11]ROT42790.1 hypothetical protein SODALDRAFT_23873 [Sodiomyces alkalinus F11]
MAKVATDFEKIIQEGRERKKNQALAERIFSKDRRQSAPAKTKPGTGPSLASRVGVKKRTSMGPSKPIPAGNVNGDWTHDLHPTVNNNNNNNGGGRSLASRVGVQGTKKIPTGPRRTERRAEQRAARLGNALEREDAAQSSAPVPPSAPASMGLSIRGLAGPFAVMAQNFAPGTTAADIESAMTPVGGEMLSCTIMKTSPIMVVEMLFASREGGEAVIATFNNKPMVGSSRSTPNLEVTSRSLRKDMPQRRDRVATSSMASTDSMTPWPRTITADSIVIRSLVIIEEVVGAVEAEGERYVDYL